LLKLVRKTNYFSGNSKILYLTILLILFKPSNQLFFFWDNGFQVIYYLVNPSKKTGMPTYFYQKTLFSNHF